MCVCESGELSGDTAATTTTSQLTTLQFTTTILIIIGFNKTTIDLYYKLAIVYYKSVSAFGFLKGCT